ncbi:MAG TPA: flagellar basal body P-ring formation chaperone FlgA [Chthonomonadaceae bacterium]|nr:flagellar basal body P-ring formation chaperone FlgA [Chthonomonadaceae bacterium]
MRTLISLLLCASIATQVQAQAHKIVNPPTPPAKKAGTTGVKAAEPAVHVVVRPVAEVEARTFTLGEIADITGQDKALQDQLAAVEVGASPLPGMSRPLLPGDVTVHIRAARLESNRVEVVLPPEIRISRKGHDVAKDDITKAALDAAQPAIKDIPNATLEALPGSDKVTVPTGKVQIVAGAWRGQPETGNISVPVSVTVDGKPLQIVVVALRIHRKQTVLVARRQIEPHDILNAADVIMAVTDLPAGFSQPLMSLEQAIGKRATRRIPADSPVPADALETPPAIAAGDKVTIEFIFGPVHVTAPGLARRAGAVGETIRVHSDDTNRDLDAVIIDSHTVRIETH